MQILVAVMLIHTLKTFASNEQELKKVNPILSKNEILDGHINLSGRSGRKVVLIMDSLSEAALTILAT